MWWLLSVLALGAPGDDLPVGSLVLDVTPGARLEVFPRVAPDRIELAVHGNSKPLDVQLEGRKTGHVVDAWAATMGSGTWFVTLYVDAPGVAVAPRFENGTGWILETRQGARAVPLVRSEPPGVDALLDNTVARRPARPREIPLTPLFGDAWSARLDPREVRLPVESWTPKLPGFDQAEPSMAKLDALHQRLATTSDDDERTRVLQHLALTHQALGLHREARYYFGEVSRQHTEWPAAAVQLHRADAALATGRWDEALERCRDARKVGASDGDVLACLGGVALATGAPSPTDTAAALVQATEAPEGRLIAAQLYVVDGRHDEALPLLQELELTGDLQRWRDATLGDVLLALGDLEGARGAWRDVGTRGLLGALGGQRARLIRLSEAAPSTWATELPSLSRDGAGPGLPAAEAHYVGAQIGRAYDEAEVAARHLTALVDKHPDVTARSDVAQRLLAVCDRRLRLLHKVERFADEAAFYHDCWREELDPIALDVAPQQGAAEAFAALGLWDDALRVQRRVVGSLTRSDREDFGALLLLAKLYDRTGRAPEALDTVTYARRLPQARTESWRLDLVQAQSHADLGEMDKALALWARAEQTPGGRAEASVKRAMALADAGRCREARPVLQRFAAGDDDLASADVGLDDARLAVARCLLDEGRAADALAEARAVAKDVPGTIWAEQASWIAGAAATELPGEPMPEAPLSPSSGWTAAVAELRQVEAVEARIEALRRKR